MDSIKINSLQTKMVAHRGLSGIELENTNASFIAAGNRSYYGIETDIHVTADGRFVIFHDDTTGRICDEDLRVEDTDYAVLRALHLNDKYGDRERADTLIPSLKEYISTCKRYDKTAVLELKNAMEKNDIAKIIKEIKELGWLERVIFISFSFQNMLYVRELEPGHPAQFLMNEFQPDMPQVLGAHGLDVDIEYSVLTEERIRAFHEHGVKVNCWTCDDRDFAENLAKWGIDYITSNILE